MNKYFNCIALLMAVLLPSFANAYDFEENGIYYSIYDSSGTNVSVTYKNTSYNSYSGTVVVPATVTHNGATFTVAAISDRAFSGCSGLTSVTIPNSVTLIGEYAFSGCSGLTSVTIPNSVTSIDGSAFSGCSGLTSVTISNSVISISRYAFNGCSGLTSVTIGNSVTSIDDYAFSGCTGLTNVTIPNSVTSISNNAFYYCSGLKNVTIGSSVNSIGESAFKECRKLRTVSLPYSLMTINSSAFYYCEDLTDVTCLAVTPPNMGNYSCIYPAYYMATLHVPEKSVEAYKATDWWSCFINIVGDASEDSNIPSTPVTDKCDTNGDGEVNIADVNRVIDEILSH